VTVSMIVAMMVVAKGGNSDEVHEQTEDTDY